ncbi:MAG: aminopeptidase [Candidatus Thermoplasmatota archaeon]|nr:leucyl aminopeptidase [Euryarchaeota archaeon]MBU4031683.1 aminopeptidase [Candidatus Thermoplasmatota archaeon]MBU4071716.1 aminopeptidase [Candidatus Thermoplasmatota archaeon]MBU4143919.1 aminopeptidase [Candidatus Thermoplasmatota archaeon]MBU4591671.1 aminopeptidase [Candidatus Thermoplasmatota archaeon]
MAGAKKSEGVDAQFDEMVEGAKNALRTVLCLKEGEDMLIVVDDSKKDIGMAFEKGAKILGANTHTYSLSNHVRPILDVPGDLSGMFKDYGVIINTFGSDSRETPFRVKLLYEEIQFNARVGHAPGITTSMMREGPMKVDYSKIVAEADKLMDAFRNVVQVHITSPSGTDVTLELDSRLWQTDVKIKEGDFGNLPAGEVWCAPVENGANGILVVDGSIGDLGQVPSPLTLRLKAGKLISIECADKAFAKEVEELSHIDDMASIVGELGIGLNPGARIVGVMLEDEKASETAHIAFGNNLDMNGGNNDSKTHRDYLFYKPTIVATYKDGSTKIMLKNGKVVCI